MSHAKQEHRQLIKELIELNDELENYFRNTIIPQLFVDANLILRKFSPPAMKHFRLSPEHIGRPIEELGDNIRYSTIIENIHQVIDTEEIFEKEIQTTDLKWFQMNIIPYVVKRERKTNGVIITFVDITARIRELKELEKLNTSHETFIYSVSHDLKAPLANIDGLVQHLIKTSAKLMEKFGAENEGQKKIAAMLEESVSRMRNIIDELSEITKIEGKYKESTETLHFENILHEVKMTIWDQIYESNARITTEILEPTLEFSRKNFRSILYNLLSNAIKYKSPSRVPQIHIKIEKEDGYVLLSVKDNGLGIADEAKDQLFTPYTRFEKRVEGIGIGLYLIKKIIENEGGKIIVKSLLGEGTEFKVYLKSNM